MLPRPSSLLSRPALTHRHPLLRDRGLAPRRRLQATARCHRPDLGRMRAHRPCRHRPKTETLSHRRPSLHHLHRLSCRQRHYRHLRSPTHLRELTSSRQAFRHKWPSFLRPTACRQSSRRGSFPGPRRLLRPKPFSSPRRLSTATSDIRKSTSVIVTISEAYERWHPCLECDFKPRKLSSTTCFFSNGCEIKSYCLRGDYHNRVFVHSVFSTS